MKVLFHSFSNLKSTHHPLKSMCHLNTFKYRFSFFSTDSNNHFNIKASSGYRFGCLAKIVNYMKVCLWGDCFPFLASGFIRLIKVKTPSLFWSHCVSFVVLSLGMSTAYFLCEKVLSISLTICLVCCCRSQINFGRFSVNVCVMIHKCLCVIRWSQSLSCL